MAATIGSAPGYAGAGPSSRGIWCNPTCGRPELPKSCGRCGLALEHDTLGSLVQVLHQVASPRIGRSPGIPFVKSKWVG